MASIKRLKKGINNICSELFSECLFCRFYIPGVKPGKADEIIVELLKMQTDFIKRANCPDGKHNKKLVKSHYSKLRSDFLQKTEQIIKELESISKENV